LDNAVSSGVTSTDTKIQDAIIKYFF
jgi:hypothetical protein